MGDKPMNILFVVPEYPPRNIGGGGIVYKNLAKELKNEGHSIKVLAGNFRNNQVLSRIEGMYEDGVEVCFLPLLSFPQAESLNFSTYTLPTITGLMFLIRELIRSRHDVIHLHGFCHLLIDISAFICFLRGKKYLMTCHGIPKSPKTASLIWRTFFRIYLATIERLVVRKAATVTTVSRYMLNECLKEGLVNKKMITIPNGPNIDLLEIKSKPTNAIEEKYSLRGKRVIFSIGRLTLVKGFQYLIRAMERIAEESPETVAIIAGSGSSFGTLKNLIYDRGLSNNIKLIGYINEEVKAAFYERSDVFVFPSIEEPFGIALLEALDMHKPIVAFKAGSTQELIEDKKNCLLVPLGDHEKLAEAIILIMNDETLRKRLIANTNERINAFSWEEIAKKYTNAYLKT